MNSQWNGCIKRKAKIHVGVERERFLSVGIEKTGLVFAE
jgi:hypothetical protein